MRRGSFVPGTRRTWVGLDTPAGVQQIAEHHLRLGQLLFGGLVAPGKGLFVVLLDPVAFGQHHREIVLRDAVALLGGAAIPFCRLRQIDGDALPVQYMTAICSCAPVWPCSAASRNQTEAISVLRATSPPRR